MGRTFRAATTCFVVAMIVGTMGVVATGVMHGPAGATPLHSAPPPRVGGSAGAKPVEHVLIVSLPAITWADIQRQMQRPDAPRGFGRVLAGAATGALSLRSILRHTTPGEGYATIGAGTRTAGALLSDNLAFTTAEQYQGAPARDAWARRTGRASGGNVVSLGLPAVQARNRTRRFGSRPGAFGDAVRARGYRTAVIANADLSRALPTDSQLERTAVLGLAGSDGTVDGGEVSNAVLADDPAAPFGLSLDQAAVVQALEEAWTERSVILLELSDLVRADAERPLTTPDARTALVDGALDRTARLLDAVLDAHVFDPARDGLLVIGPHHPAAAVHLGVLAARRPGRHSGALRSPSTRRAGYATLVDVAPTVLDWIGADRPASMEGRAAEFVADPRSQRSRIAALVRADRDARLRDGLVAPVTVAFVVVEALVALAAVAVLGRVRRGRRALEIAALSLYGYLAAVYLAVPLHVAEHGAGVYFAFLAAIAVAGAGIAIGAGRKHDLVPPTILLGGLIALHTADLVTGGRLQFNSVLGYSPTVGGRFAGAGNLTFSQLSAAAIVLAGVVAVLRTRTSRVAAAAIVMLAVVVDGVPLWGADVGGVLSLVPAGIVTVAALTGRRLRLRFAALVVAGTAAAIALAAALDMARPADRRTHLGRLVESVRDDGFGAFTRVVERKAAANLSVLTTSVWTLLVPVVLLFIASLIYRSPGRLRMISDRAPELRASFAGVFVLAVLGYSLNDSGIAVPALMLGVLNPVLVYLAARWT